MRQLIRDNELLHSLVDLAGRQPVLTDEFKLASSSSFFSPSSLELVNGDWILSESPFQILTTIGPDPSMTSATYSFSKSIIKTPYGQVMDVLQNPYFVAGASIAIGALTLVYAGVGASTYGIGFIVGAPIFLGLSLWMNDASSKLQERCDFNSSLISRFTGPEFTIASVFKQSIEADLCAYDDATCALILKAAENFLSYAENAIYWYAEPMDDKRHNLLGDAMVGKLPPKIDPISFVDYQAAFNGFLRDVSLIKLSRGLAGTRQDMKRQKELLKTLDLGYHSTLNEAYKTKLLTEREAATMSAYANVCNERFLLQKLERTSSLTADRGSRSFYTSLLPRTVGENQSVYITNDKSKKEITVQLSPVLNDMDGVRFKVNPHVEVAEQITEVEAGGLVGWIDTELEHASNRADDAKIEWIKKHVPEEFQQDMIDYVNDHRYKPLIKMEVVVKQTIGFTMLIRQPQMVPNGTRETVLLESTIKPGRSLEIAGDSLLVAASFGQHGGLSGGIKVCSNDDFSVKLGPRTESAIHFNSLSEEEIAFIGAHIGDDTSFGEFLRWLQCVDSTFELDRKGLSRAMTDLAMYGSEGLGHVLQLTILRQDDKVSSIITPIGRAAEIAPWFKVTLTGSYVGFVADANHIFSKPVRWPILAKTHIVGDRVCDFVVTTVTDQSYVESYSVTRDGTGDGGWWQPTVIPVHPECVQVCRVGSLLVPTYATSSYYAINNGMNMLIPSGINTIAFRSKYKACW